MEDLNTRVSRLEKSASRWKAATMSLLALATGAIFMGQITLGGGTGGMRAPLITADQFVANKSLTLKDADGKTRMVLSAENDTPEIVFKNKDDKTLMRLSLDPKSQAIVIQDDMGKKLFGAP